MEASWVLQSIDINATKRMVKGIGDEDGLLVQVGLIELGVIREK